jgi:hypothetical protein
LGEGARLGAGGDCAQRQVGARAPGPRDDFRLRHARAVEQVLDERGGDARRGSVECQCDDGRRCRQMQGVGGGVGPVAVEQGDQAELVAARDHRQLERQPVRNGRRLTAETLLRVTTQAGQGEVGARRPGDGHSRRRHDHRDGAAYLVRRESGDALQAAAGQPDVEHRAVERVPVGRGCRCGEER